MKIQIKKFHQLSLDELYEILKLRVDVFVVEQECAYPELDDLDQKADHVYVLSEDEIISYLRIYYPEPNKAAIGRVVTKAKSRGKGLSRKMMEAAMDFIEKNNSIDKMYLQAQEHLTKFYASFGFKEKSESYLEDGIPHVDMERDNVQ